MSETSDISHRALIAIHSQHLDEYRAGEQDYVLPEVRQGHARFFCARLASAPEHDKIMYSLSMETGGEELLMLRPVSSDLMDSQTQPRARWRRRHCGVM